MNNNKRKVLITKGLSFSGKSTFAKEKAKELGNTLIVTKDDIRHDRFGVRYNDPNSPKVKESKVIAVRDEMILEGLRKGMNIISADTNLSKKTNHIKSIKALVYPKYRETYDVEVIDFMDTPLDELLSRAEKTTRLEGKDFWVKVVKEQAEQFLEPPIIKQDETLPKCIITDYDGTLFRMCDRSPYSGIGSENDIPNDIVIDYIKIMKEQGYTIFILSGLEDKYKDIRENCLSAHGIPYDFLYMRKAGDGRKDYIIKNEIFEEHIKDKFFVYSILDDRRQMLEYWINAGYSERLFGIGNFYKYF